MILKKINNIWLLAEEHLVPFMSDISRVTAEQIKAIESIEIGGAAISRINGDVMTVNINGLLMEDVPAWMRFYGYEATGYSEIREAVQTAIDSPMIKQVVFNVNSPGGNVLGVAETADIIAALSKVKQTISITGGLCASAAYYLASQTKSIVAGVNASVGSIGVYTYLYDWSGYFAEAGIKTIVISSGKYKGTGVFGAEVTEEQLVPIRENIAAMAENFYAAIKAGRKLDPSKMEEITSGRTWVGQQALNIGLVDKVEINVNSIFNKDKKMSAENNQAQPTATDDITKTVQAAVTAGLAAARADDQKRLTELKAAFPDDAAFAAEQFAAGASVEQAKAAYCDVLRAKLASQPAAAAAEGAAAPVPFGHSAAGAPTDILAAAKLYAAEHKCSFADAYKACGGTKQYGEFIKSRVLKQQ
jgi:signal peptide peptidase SppA